MTPTPLRLMHQPRRLWLFLLAVVLALAADLGSKVWSFHSVAAHPVVLRREAGRPVAYERLPNPAGGTSEVVANAGWSNAGQIPRHEPVVVVPKVLNLHLVVNQGAVFGLGQGKRALFLLASVAAVATIGWVLLRSGARDWPLHLALGLILAGALGNMYDRVMFGGVRDMLHMLPGVPLPFGWKWPGQAVSECWPWVFNLADVELLAGVGLVLLLGLRKPKEDAPAEAPRA